MKKFILIGLWVILIDLTFSTCSKEKPPACEEWEVEDAGFNVGACNTFSCVGSRTLQLIFCRDALKDAKAGNEIILSEDQCCIRTRTFKRFIRTVE